MNKNILPIIWKIRKDKNHKGEHTAYVGNIVVGYCAHIKNKEENCWYSESHLYFTNKVTGSKQEAKKWVEISYYSFLNQFLISWDEPNG